jgi:hypothetical protein
MNASARILFSALLVCVLGGLMPRIAHSQVVVTSADPPSAPQGTLSLDVTVSGSGFDSSAQVEFLLTGTTNPGGVTVRKVKVTGPKKLVATIDVAETAVIDKFDIQVSLSGGRKGKGTSLFAVLAKTNDQCAALNLDFPAFTFWRWAGQYQQIFVADATGQCIRPVLTVTDSIGFADWVGYKFSYPVAGTTNVGRLVWTSHDNVEMPNLIYVFTFQVTGTSVSNGTLDLIHDSYPVPLYSVNLSPDGTTVYFTLGANAPSASDYVMAIDADGSNLREVFVDPTYGAHLFSLVPNEDGGFFVRQDNSDSGMPNKLFKIGASCDNPSCWVALAESPIETHGVNFPAASLVDDRFVYSYSLPGYIGCWLLQVIPDTGGPILNSGQPRYGRDTTWYGGKILTDGIKAPTRQGRCDSTGMITQIDPDTSAETQLVIGDDPDAR